VVISLQQGADLHIAQLMPLPLTVSCFSKIQIGFAFLVPAHPGSPRKRAVKRMCVCVCAGMVAVNTPLKPPINMPCVEQLLTIRIQPKIPTMRTRYHHGDGETICPPPMAVRSKMPPRVGGIIRRTSQSMYKPAFAMQNG